MGRWRKYRLEMRLEMNTTTSTPIKAEIAILTAVIDISAARNRIAQALTDRGIYYGDRPDSAETADLLEIYNRLRDLHDYCERKIDAIKARA